MPVSVIIPVATAEQIVMAASTLVEDVQVGSKRASSLGKVRPSKMAALEYPSGIHQVGIGPRRKGRREDIGFTFPGLASLHPIGSRCPRKIDARASPQALVLWSPPKKHISGDFNRIADSGGRKSREDCI
jgi:hypothetical protein